VRVAAFTAPDLFIMPERIRPWRGWRLKIKQSVKPVVRVQAEFPTDFLIVRVRRRSVLQARAIELAPIVLRTKESGHEAMLAAARPKFSPKALGAPLLTRLPLELEYPHMPSGKPLLHFFTVVAQNYLPKAAVLGRSIHRHHGDRARFHVILLDAVPAELARRKPEYIDSILTIEQLDLPIENRLGWIFKHTIVELCTAVKAQAALQLFEKTGAKHLVYLDPDIWVLRPLDGLLAHFRGANILLTPHQTQPDSRDDVIRDNELGSLRHGVYNLGFLGLKRSEETFRFLHWWNYRLMKFCYDQVVEGLFTDQKWIDLVPVFFENVAVLKSPGFNVSTWNLSQRRITRTERGELEANGVPIGFFHFSGYDSGAQKIMMKKYGLGDPEVFRLREKYDRELSRIELARYQRNPWKFASFSNGEKVLPVHRRVYRERSQLQASYPNPFDARESDRSFLDWFKGSIGFLNYALNGAAVDLKQVYS
jgi:hypothetical protein